MALIVEDGTGKEDAESYVSVDEAKIIASKYGWTLPDGEPEIEQALRKSVQYVDMKEVRFSGKRRVTSQALAWPRDGAKTTYGHEIPVGTIPAQMKNAQTAAAVEYAKGVAVRANADGKEQASESIDGVISESWFRTGKADKNITLTVCEDFMTVLLVAGGNNYSFGVNRG